jgi:hypothetical protein
VQAGDPQRLVADAAYAGRSCPYCRFPMKEGGEVVLCGHCHSVHHLDCWTDNGGCAVVACAGGPAKAASAATGGPALPPTVPQPVTTIAVPVSPQPTSSAPPAATPPQVPPPGSNRPGVNRGLIAAVVVLAVAVAGVGAAVLLTRSKSVPAARAAAVVHQSRNTPATSGAAATTVTNVVTVTNSTPATSPSSNGPTTSSTSLRPTTAAPRTTSAAQVSASPAATDQPDASAAGVSAASALDNYWSGVADGNYEQAYDAETPSEQHADSVSDMESDQPQVNVMWTKPGVPDTDGEASRINFYTVDSDGVCRHFSIDSQMVRQGSQWLYDGPVAGAALVDSSADGNPNCPD